MDQANGLVISSEQNADLSTLGGRVAWARLRQGLSREALAKALGKSRASVAQYEGNNITPPIDVIRSLAEQVGTDPAYIAFGHSRTLVAEGQENNRTIPFVVRGDGLEDQSITLPFAVVSEMAGKNAKLEFQTLDVDAPTFNLRAGALLLLDTGQTVIQADGAIYALRTKTGLAVARSEPILADPNEIEFSLVSGQGTTFRTHSIKAEGRVVAAMQRYS